MVTSTSELGGVAGAERQVELVRFGAAGVISSHLPRVFTNQQAGHVTVGHAADLRVVGNAHVPLVDLLVVLDDRVLLPNVAQQSRGLLVHHHVPRIKPSSVAQSPQIELDILACNSVCKDMSVADDELANRVCQSTR